MTTNLPLILNIETSTKNCSVALFRGDFLLSEKSLLSDKYSHSETLTLFIEEVMSDVKLKLSDLSAIAVSKGPGSYTGLRIGVSTAKGLSYSLSIPLISVPTLKSMAYSRSQINSNFDLYCPMIDARRMEVFSAFYNVENNVIRNVQADIIDENSYLNYSQKSILFFGDGSAKCKEIIKLKYASFIDDIYGCARDMGIISFKKYLSNDFEDVAYFEPFYLKDFVAGKKKN
ncbi:tRNA (adenosine(37)-N6)-threonylcarbamoyltransferase complex dimerization subunit type 1 TsaB [Flavobacteriales bacterium]|nr:tRNA (adenosine(37)-N6)-threonylcarbamoyltransferase complex dimerization subunit type 1 TsaB [Flavobacteriales bacterium]